MPPDSSTPILRFANFITNNNHTKQLSGFLVLRRLDCGIASPNQSPISSAPHTPSPLDGRTHACSV